LDVVPNLKDKAKRTYSEIDSLSDLIYSPKSYESDEDSTFENDLRRAKEESKKESSYKKGESSKRSK
jgi:hypothetical protein